MATAQAVKSTGSFRKGDLSKQAVRSIGIAQIEIAQAPELIRTVLGSCIGIAMYDRKQGVGGLGHVILPSSKEGSGDPGKFADSAIDILLEKLVAAGADQKKIVAKIAGGASMFGTESAVGLGVRNADAVKDRLSHHRVRLAAEEVGGRKGRRMLLDPSTGEVKVEVIGEEPKII